MTQAELGTTNGGIAVDNLSAAVAGAEGTVRANPQTVGAYSKLILLLCMRGNYLGRIADYDQAAAISAQQLKIGAKVEQTYQARAGLRATFHDFAGALADLDRAEKMGADPAANYGQRASILHALEKTEEARVLLEKIPEVHRDIPIRGMLATFAGERGDLESAEAQFIAAQKHLPDVSPFPLAWLYMQHGQMWENEGRSGRARELYAAAVERVPGYAPATAHLAAMEAASGARPAAIERLRGLIKTSDDPEYVGQLAALLKEAGVASEAAALRTQAITRYTALLARYPLAYAAHAARFYLGIGDDPKKAVSLAEQNVKNTPTEPAMTLAIEANLAAKQTARACELASEITKRPHATPRSKVLAARAFSSCGQKANADAILQSLASK